MANGAEKWYQLLEKRLSESTGADRKKWASEIIAANMDLRFFADLLHGEPKRARRFLWLLGDLVELNGEFVKPFLPQLWIASKKVMAFNARLNFAKFWFYSGIPAENEAEAIDCLFNWWQSAQVNVSIKFYVLRNLVALTKKYPDFKTEVTAVLVDQLDKNTADFKRKIENALHDLSVN